MMEFALLAYLVHILMKERKKHQKLQKHKGVKIVMTNYQEN